MSTAALYGRIPSCTACFYDVGAHLEKIPGGNDDARMLIFLRDQQDCLRWYVLLEPERRHRVGVGYDDVAVCAEDFEGFMKRFWIENTIWFAAHEGAPPIEGELREYVDAVAKTRAA
jgi:hypothetical protein